MPKEALQPSQQSFFLTNPRGSGKSARLHTELSDAHLVHLPAEESHQHLHCSPGPFADGLLAIRPKTRVQIDKEQRGSPCCRP